MHPYFHYYPLSLYRLRASASSRFVFTACRQSRPSARRRRRQNGRTSGSNSAVWSGSCSAAAPGQLQRGRRWRQRRVQLSTGVSLWNAVAILLQAGRRRRCAADRRLSYHQRSVAAYPRTASSSSSGDVRQVSRWSRHEQPAPRSVPIITVPAAAGIQEIRFWPISPFAPIDENWTASRGPRLQSALDRDNHQTVVFPSPLKELRLNCGLT